MKKTTIKKIPSRTYTTKATTKKVETVYCDICDLNGKVSISTTRCYICGRDICYKHIAYDYSDSDDYPHQLCPICYKLKFDSEFSARREEIETQCFDNLQKLDEDIKKTSLETKTVQ